MKTFSEIDVKSKNKLWIPGDRGETALDTLVAVDCALAAHGLEIGLATAAEGRYFIAVVKRDTVSP